MYRYNTSSNQFAFRSNDPLTNDVIARYAPSVLATEPHETRGERYAFIPTVEVLDGLRKEGFQPFEVRQTKCRDVSKREFTRHMVRLRHADTITARGETPEIVLLNSHDGTSSYQLLAGIFRMVCSNGLIAGDVCNDIRIRHTGNVINDVIEGSYRVLDNINHVGERIETYRSIELGVDEQLKFARDVEHLRWGQESALNTPAALLQPRRSEDRSNDLWTVFNRAQENLIKGGLRGRSASGRRISTRAVGSVNEDVKLNRGLWTLADEIARVKLGEVTDVELLAA